jgi:hypothetical protein
MEYQVYEAASLGIELPPELTQEEKAKKNILVNMVLYGFGAIALAGGIFVVLDNELRISPDAAKNALGWLFGAAGAIGVAIPGYKLFKSINEFDDGGESAVKGAAIIGILVAISGGALIGVAGFFFGGILGAIGGAILGGIGGAANIGLGLIGGLLGIGAGGAAGWFGGYYVFGGYAIFLPILLLAGAGVLFIFIRKKYHALIAAAVIMALFGILLIFVHGNPDAPAPPPPPEEAPARTMRVTMDTGKLKYISSEKRHETLGIRAEPNAKAARICGLERGTTVTILEEGKPDTVDSIVSNWVYVEVASGEYQGRKGWLFKGYLDEDDQ